MPATEIRQCLHCGLESHVASSDFRDRHRVSPCPKCDEDLLAQTDGSVFTRDIAHQRETVARAEDKMDSALQLAWSGHARGVRLIVGGGRIRDEILGQLQYYRDQGYITGFDVESPNHGAILVRLR